MYDTSTLIKAIALSVALALALPAVARLYRALLARDWYGAFLLAFIVVLFGAFARWVSGLSF